MGNSSTRPNWKVWGHVPLATLREAVTLSLDLDPSKLKLGGRWISSEDDDKHYQFNDRMFVMRRNLGVALKPRLPANDPDESSVDLAEFGSWALSVGWALPQEFPRLAASPARPAPTWPWGTHETKLLQCLRDAAQNFWSTYDPPDTAAPTSSEVSNWLQAERGLSKNKADAITMILRADDAPIGRRKGGAEK